MKKRFFLLLSGILFLLGSCSVPNAGSGFYQAHKRKEGVRNFTLPGWLIYTGTGFAHDIVKEEELKAIMQVARKIKKMQFMLDEGNSAIREQDVLTFQQHLRDRDFDDLVYVRAEDATVSFMVRSQGDRLRDLIVLIHSEEDFVFLNMRTNITVRRLALMIDAILKLNDKEEEPKPAPPPVDEPVARPRA